MMDATTDTPAPRRFWRPRYSIRDLFVLVFGAAVGMAYARLQAWSWFHGLMAAATVWILIGLGAQATDLARAPVDPTELSGSHRSGIRFAIFWRVALAAILGAYLCVSGLLAGKSISLPEYETRLWQIGADSREALFLVSVLIVILSGPRSTVTQQPTSHRSRVYAIGTITALLVYAIMVGMNQTTITALIYNSVNGMEITGSLT